jgi:hypothetical protein
VSPVKYELGSCIPEDDTLHSDRREYLKSSTTCFGLTDLPPKMSSISGCTSTGGLNLTQTYSFTTRKQLTMTIATTYPFRGRQTKANLAVRHITVGYAFHYEHNNPPTSNKNPNISDSHILWGPRDTRENSLQIHVSKIHFNIMQPPMIWTS